MKKILFILLCAIAILVPVKANAASVSFEGYYCDDKVPLDDGTFYMVCHIVVSAETQINHVSGTLILANVNLESIKMHDDWTNNNGLSTEVDFTSKTAHTGTFTVADLVYTGDLSDEYCEASFMPDVVDYEKPQNFVCMIVDGVYYGKNGTQVSEVEYYEECCNYTCTVIDNKYYFDSHGNSVTYEEMIEDCSTTDIVVDPKDPVENPQTGINYGYIFLPIGIISIIVIVKVARKNTKIYKI